MGTTHLPARAQYSSLHSAYVEHAVQIDFRPQASNSGLPGPRWLRRARRKAVPSIEDLVLRSPSFLSVWLYRRATSLLTAGKIESTSVLVASNSFSSSNVVASMDKASISKGTSRSLMAVDTARSVIENAFADWLAAVKTLAFRVSSCTR